MHPAGGCFGIVDNLGACQSLDNCFVPHTIACFFLTISLRLHQGQYYHLVVDRQNPAAFLSLGDG